MATDQDFLEYVVEQAEGAGMLSHRRMFGEYALYLDGKVVALVCDNQLFCETYRSRPQVSRRAQGRFPVSWRKTLVPGG